MNLGYAKQESHLFGLSPCEKQVCESGICETKVTPVRYSTGALGNLWVPFFINQLNLIYSSDSKVPVVFTDRRFLGKTIFRQILSVHTGTAARVSTHFKIFLGDMCVIKEELKLSRKIAQIFQILLSIRS